MSRCLVIAEFPDMEGPRRCGVELLAHRPLSLMLYTATSSKPPIYKYNRHCLLNARHDLQGCSNAQNFTRTCRAGAYVKRVISGTLAAKSLGSMLCAVVPRT